MVIIMFNNLQQKINSEMSKKDIYEIIKLEKKEFMNELKNLINQIKDGKSKEEFYKEIQDNFNNKKFIEVIDDLISPQLIPYDETAYFREVSFEDFKYIIDNIFEKTIIQYEQISVIKDKTKLENDQIRCACKFLNTLVGWYIVRRYTQNCFESEVYNIFRMDSKRAMYIYDKFGKCQDELIKIVMLDNILICREIKNEIKKLVDIFSEIFEKDDNETEES